MAWVAGRTRRKIKRTVEYRSPLAGEDMPRKSLDFLTRPAIGFAMEPRREFKKHALTGAHRENRRASAPLSGCAAHWPGVQRLNISKKHTNQKLVFAGMARKTSSSRTWLSLGKRLDHISMLLHDTLCYFKNIPDAFLTGKLQFDRAYFRSGFPCLCFSSTVQQRL